MASNEIKAAAEALAVAIETAKPPDLVALLAEQLAASLGGTAPVLAMRADFIGPYLLALLMAKREP